MNIEYRYSELNKPITFSEHSFARQVANQPDYEKSTIPVDAVYIQAPCIP